MKVRGGTRTNMGGKGEQRQQDVWMGTMLTVRQAHLQGQSGLRGGSPDLREKLTECMPGPHRHFHPAHCCSPITYCSDTLKQGHLRSRCTSDAATTLEPIPWEMVQEQGLFLA